MHPAFLYLPGVRLSQSELSAARIDGHVVEVGDAYIPADLLEDAGVRAHSLVRLVRPGTAASGPTAAWIHGAGDTPPVVHHVKRSVERRLRPHTSARLVFHDSLLAASDLQRLGGIDVSTPERTMLDLATTLHRDPRVMVWMQRLALMRPELPSSAGERLRAMRRVPGSRVALSALARLAVRTR